MPNDPTSRTIVFLVLLGLVAWAIWLVWPILPPFLIALALALLLDPVMDRMVRRGMPRWLAVSLTFLAFMGIFFGLIAVVAPLAVGQITEFVANQQTYAARVESTVNDWLRSHSSTLRQLNIPPTLPELTQQYRDNLTGGLQVLLQRAIEAIQSSFGALGWVVVVPIVTLYLLMDLDRLRHRVHLLIPDVHRPTVEDLAGKVGGVFGAYIRGLTLICLSYGTLVYLVLTAGFGLRYSLVLGLLAAFLYAVPYLGQFVVIAAACGVAWATGPLGPHILILGLCLLGVGQLFDQLITPRIIGRQVGLHPVLGLFALMAGGQLFGLPGMVLAVPVAASMRVVLIHLFPRLSEPLPPRQTRKRRDEPPPTETRQSEPDAV